MVAVRCCLDRCVTRGTLRPGCGALRGSCLVTVTNSLGWLGMGPNGSGVSLGERRLDLTRVVVSMASVRRWLLVVAVLGLALCAPAAAAAAAQPEFADWTAVAGNTATGTLLGQSISLSGTHVWPTPVSVLDGSWTFFDGPDFTPALPDTDVIQISGSAPAFSYTLAFGAPVTNPVLEIGSLGSRLDFPAGTQITRVSGDSGFSVSGSSVIGTPSDALGVDQINDSNGTVELTGTFSSISFTAAYPISIEDGILIQVGAVAPTPPPTQSVQPVARLTVSPDPTCVGVPTTLDASASTPGTGARITGYSFTYFETNVVGALDSSPTVLADSPAPVATVRFPWSYEAGLLAPGPRKVLGNWVRAPADVTLTITDSTGSTASTTMPASFAQSSSRDSVTECPGGPPAPANVPQTPTRPRTDGSRISFPVICPASTSDCSGDILASTPSLPLISRLEKTRLAFQADQDRIDALNKHVADGAARVRKSDLTDLDVARGFALLDAGLSPAQLAASLGITITQAQFIHDEWVAREEQAVARDRAAAARRAIQKILDQLRDLQSRVRISRATPRRPTILASVAYRIAPGHTAHVSAPLSRGARTVLRRYNRLDLTLTIAPMGPKSRGRLTSRPIAIRLRPQRARPSASSAQAAR
jgi:hypothetical protein